MRWNCPHCEELVTAGIDFENTKKAYVRCAKCNGMALVHRSAVLADYVKARRMEEEAQLEAELRLTQTATANSRVQAMEGQIRGLNEKLSTAANAKGTTTPPPPNAAMNTTMEMEMIMPELPSPPPFASSFEPMEEHEAEITIINDVSAAPPVFMYSKPPAFLLRKTANAIETLERSFAIDGDVAPMEAITATPVTHIKNLNTTSEVRASDPKVASPSMRPTIALWVAAIAAIGSGSYLYIEGKKALAPSVQTPASIPAVDAAKSADATVQADAIRSNANSAIRPETRAIAIVRVPRATLRTGPSIDATPVQTLERSSVANIVELKDGWMRLESPRITTTNRTAWVRADLVVLMPK
jgi:hypothetical protein